MEATDPLKREKLEFEKDDESKFWLNMKVRNQANEEDLTGESKEQRDADLLEVENELQNRMLPDVHKLDANQGEMMPFELLKKYIIYSKRHFKPKLNKIDPSLGC